MLKTNGLCLLCGEYVSSVSSEVTCTHRPYALQSTALAAPMEGGEVVQVFTHSPSSEERIYLCPGTPGRLWFVFVGFGRPSSPCPQQYPCACAQVEVALHALPPHCLQISFIFFPFSKHSLLALAPFWVCLCHQIEFLVWTFFSIYILLNESLFFFPASASDLL